MNTSTMDSTGLNPRPQPVPLDGSPGIERPLRSAFLIILALGSLSMLTTIIPGTASAQTIQRLDTCLTRAGDATNGYTYTNDCGHTVAVRGALQASVAGSRSCTGLSQSETIIASGTYSILASALPGRLCFEYSSARTQYDSGNRSCSTVTSVDLSQCGTGNDLTVHPPSELPDGSISLSSTTLATIEGAASSTVQVSLTLDDTDDANNPVPPVSSVVLDISSNNSSVTVSPATMTFSTTNYGTNQNISITAIDDDDGDDENATVTITPATTSGLHLDNGTITVSVTDDNQSIDVDGGDEDDAENTVTLDEGDTRTFSVKLEKAPAAGTPVVVTVASSDDGAISVSSAEDSDTTDDEITLSFTDSNYETNQEVTITAENDTDGTSESGVTITFSATKATDVTRTFDVTDDDGSIELSSAAVSAEEGNTGTFTVKLGAPPASSAVLSVTSGATGSATVSPATLTFSTSNYDTTQTVTVTGVQDNDGTDDSATITVGVSSGYTASNQTKSITVEDDDGAINVSSAAVSAVEGGSTGTFTVTLAAPPASSAVISVTSGDTSVGTVAPATLTFSDTNYSTAQTVTITAVNDTDGTDDTDDITLMVSSGYRADDASKEFDVVDDDGSIEFSESGVVTVPEEDTNTFNVTLGAPPASSVSISVASADVNVATVSPGTLTFTSGNYGTAQTVTVRGSKDKDYVDDSTDIRFTVADLDEYRIDNNNDHSDDNDTVEKDISVDDDDMAPVGRIVIRKTNDAGIVEGSEGSVWGISLSTAPDEPIDFDVTVSLTVGGTHPRSVTVSPSTLTFLPMSPSKEQLITITPADDNDYDNQSASINISASGGISPTSQDIPIIVIDDDTPPVGTIVLDDTGLLTLNEGQSGTFNVRLGSDTIPTLDVDLSFESSDTDAIKISPPSITFQAANFTIAQRVTITAVDDSNYDDENISIILNVSGGIAAPSVTKLIEVFDDDLEPMMVLSDQRLSLGEDQSTTISVKLNQQTPVPVNVSTSMSSPDIVVEPSSFSFEPSQWNTPRPVSVYVRADSNRRNDFGIITFTARSNKLGSPFEHVTFNLPVEMTEVTAPPGGGGGTSPPTPTLSIQSHALAIPPPSAQDQANVRIWCRHRQPCTVAFECSAQEDGMFMEGQLAQPIPSMGTVTLSATEIAEIIGGSWEGKGRLGCALLSDGDLMAQVWTRSGDGVLINNSATLRSVNNLVDIHDIPAPDSSDISNIRIRCPTEYPGDCQNVSLKCHDNEGMPYTGFLGTIERGAVFHMQTADLSEIIVHRWQGSDLFCQVSGSRPFTVQVLTRTGGGGALVNNSARGGLM